jgi:hypothetical protein
MQPCAVAAAGGERGQATVEWIALLLLAGLLLGVLVLTAASRLFPGLPLVHAIGDRLICAVRLSADCTGDERLESAHGQELTALLQAHAPTLLYEDGMRALPVDFRRCRVDACAEGGTGGTVSHTVDGRPVVAFTHTIDCRPESIRASTESGADCSGDRRGNLYLQYWFYYPGSATGEGSTPLRGVIRGVSTAIGKPTHHADDWEGYQVRIGPDGRFARATSHKGYGYQLGGSSLIPGHELHRTPDGTLVLRRRPAVANGWGPDVGTLYVSGGSHAGSAHSSANRSRITKGHRLRLIPLRWIALQAGRGFAVTPPWEKRVYRDPEYGGTD